MQHHADGESTENPTTNPTADFGAGVTDVPAQFRGFDTAPTQQEFDEQYNLSYLPPDLPKASVLQVFKHYLASLAIYGGLLTLLLLNPWFTTILSISVREVTGRQIYLYLFVAYAAIAPICYLCFRPRSLWTSKNLMIVGYLTRVTRLLFRRGRTSSWRLWRPDYKETQALMFLLVKIIYGPLMLHSTMLELGNMDAYYFQLTFQSNWLYRLDVWYILAISAVFVLDSSMFFTGYTTEAGFLRNRLRYVETNVFHILICICCYAPFNMVTASILGPSNYDVGILYLGDVEHPATWVLRGLAMLCLLGLISSSLFLFTRASNLTNRGIVKIGPYAIVRHPGYISKNLFWLMTIIPILIPDTEALGFSWSSHVIICVKVCCGFLAWAAIYYLRAITEERFLSRDPEYVEYCRRVKYRFIPGVY
jgi:protein-S-isoprenylcysteine O-methyltransferase Ste14